MSVRKNRIIEYERIGSGYFRFSEVSWADFALMSSLGVGQLFFRILGVGRYFVGDWGSFVRVSALDSLGLFLDSDA